jgi:serine/threonine protein kinase
LINSTDIAPKVFYLSPEARISPSDLPLGTSRFVGSYLNSNLDACVASGTTVRFMIQEQAGPSLHEIAKYYKDDRSAELSKFMIEVARSLIDKLEILHSLGIVHGDIHAGNIVYRRPVDDIDDIENVDFALIDFEHAIFFPRNFGRPNKSDDFLNLTPRYLSLWQLAGERMGPRDDIYRLMYMLGDILSKGKYRDGVSRMLEANLDLFSISDEDGQADMAEKIEYYAKANCFLFRHSPELGSKAVTGLPAGLDMTVLEKLDAIHSHIVSTYVDPDMKIDYRLIKASLDEVIALYP